jgi:hypothetical protein
MSKTPGVFVAFCLAALAQPETSSDLTQRVRQHTQASIAGLPNYSCLETMNRSVHNAAGQLQFRERLRLEVLMTETTELFAWPGSSNFKPADSEQWIGSGAIATGSFGSYLQNLFVAGAGALTYSGEEVRDHRVAIRGNIVQTGYSGTFWVNKETLDLSRLEAKVDEIPVGIDCREARES